MRKRFPLLLSFCTLSLVACAAFQAPLPDGTKRGQFIYAKECSVCHGINGVLDTAVASNKAPDLTLLTLRNDGSFPREFVRRFVIGSLERESPDAAMPEFKDVGLRHVYPEGGADGEVLEADFEDLLDYLEAIQK